MYHLCISLLREISPPYRSGFKLLLSVGRQVVLPTSYLLKIFRDVYPMVLPRSLNSTEKGQMVNAELYVRCHSVKNCGRQKKSKWTGRDFNVVCKDFWCISKVIFIRFVPFIIVLFACYKPIAYFNRLIYIMLWYSFLYLECVYFWITKSFECYFYFSVLKNEDS